MEKKEYSDIQKKSVTKIKWIVTALLLVLWSSHFSYSQENDSIKNKINITELKSYQKFRESEMARTLTLKERNSIFTMVYKLVANDTRHWFREFAEIDLELKNIFDQMPKDDKYIKVLNNFLSELNHLYINEKNVECRLAITYMKSRISDEKIRFLDWISKVDELLKRQLKVWDIILLNKKNSPFDIWTKALKVFDEKYLTDFTHALIFIWFDDDWNILVRHSTTATEKFHRIGVENTTLNSYIFDKDRSGAEWYDIAVLRPDESILQSLLKSSEDKLGCWYDNLSALRQWFWLPNTFDDKYNCVELVTQSMEIDENKRLFYSDTWEYSFLWKLQRDIENMYNVDLKNEVQELKSMTHPNNLFEFPNLVTPVYLSTIKK